MTVKELLNVMSVDTDNGNYGTVSIKITRHLFDGTGYEYTKNYKPDDEKKDFEEFEHDGPAWSIEDEIGNFDVARVTVGTSKHNRKTVVLKIVCVLTPEQFADYEAKIHNMFAELHARENAMMEKAVGNA